MTYNIEINSNQIDIAQVFRDAAKKVLDARPENKRRNGMADRVRGAASLLKVFSRRDVYYHIDDQKPLSLKEEKCFHRTWDDLRKRGEIERLDRATYQYNQGKRPQSDVRYKIYRAMHVKGAFCAADIKQLTDADHSYILTICRRLWKEGWLKLTGKNGKHKVYMIKDPDRFYLEFVK